jgi:hypothetical protein
MNSNIAADDAVLRHAAANNRPLGNNRIHGRALAIGPIKTIWLAIAIPSFEAASSDCTN